MTVHMRITDARAFEQRALFQNARKAAAALGSLPRVTAELVAIELRQACDDACLQVFQKPLYRSEIHAFRGVVSCLALWADPTAWPRAGHCRAGVHGARCRGGIACRRSGFG